ncbi:MULTISPECIES: MBL fold metallo-hydrolase [Chryseobacterium]|jgi:pyrroloquinoline quinone biosynthesis protein B|uniref:Pyrroloquinoline quinone biosynthesis protein B n=2 Tax=Chryseobacterium TaxID=59732 RepID=A0A543EN86_9FLAO|nr:MULTISPECIES: MBL fold metallo-hydrolase [Chryseobacterium]MDR6487725.1 pyrroloquinoline quinone biosynthesis protein B [Chryseobacterium vietnamense]TQM23047.1 pyrroloquinoline quinone biosynthesis protein B [Chryseobacterium aquifrigidense]
MKQLFILFSAILFTGPSYHSQTIHEKSSSQENVKIIILGNVQDAGSPQIGCRKECCMDLWKHPKQDRKVSSLGVIDNGLQKNYIFDATPDFTQQLQLLMDHSAVPKKTVPDGIFITHAHIGHYTGLMFLGKEAMNSKAVPVYTMPRLKKFFETNGPWSQLIRLNNIAPYEMQNEVPIKVNSNLEVTPIQVPHRDEYSETVGFIIKGPHKKALFIPDIDKWNKWKHNIAELIKTVDYAFLDGTFYDSEEIGYRNIEDIPHPFVVESMELFKNLSPEYKKRIFFIHFNHSNKILNQDSKQSKQVIEKGFNIARLGDEFEL